MILFKIKAYLEINERMQSGIYEQGADHNKKKHKKDVLNLARILEPEERLVVNENVKRDIKKFIHFLEADTDDSAFLQVGVEKHALIKLFNQVYQLE